MKRSLMMFAVLAAIALPSVANAGRFNFFNRVSLRGGCPGGQCSAPADTTKKVQQASPLILKPEAKPAAKVEVKAPAVSKASEPDSPADCGG